MIAAQYQGGEAKSKVQLLFIGLLLPVFCVVYPSLNKLNINARCEGFPVSSIPYSEMIPYGRQTISEQDIAAVVDILKSIWLTQGLSVERWRDSPRHVIGRALREGRVLYARH